MQIIDHIYNNFHLWEYTTKRFYLRDSNHTCEVVLPEKWYSTKCKFKYKRHCYDIKISPLDLYKLIKIKRKLTKIYLKKMGDYLSNPEFINQETEDVVRFSTPEAAGAPIAAVSMTSLGQ